MANFLGNARSDSGDADGAVAMLRVALAAGDANAGGSGGIGGSGGNRGIDHYAPGRALALQHQPRDTQEALEHFSASARLLKTSIGAGSIYTQRSLSAAALARERLGRLDQAAHEFEALDATNWPPPERAQHDLRVAELRSHQGRHDEAVALARHAADVLLPEKSKSMRAAAEASLGKALLAAGNREEAATALQAALRLWSERQTVASPDRTEAATLLARALQ